jgi:penicillin-binding protein 1C
MSYKEALAGSYNLAAIHVLERVGVPALHARLRRAGVAELASPPARYGLQLALGSARVRLLDVASGYGFLVRGGLTQPAHAIESLERSDGSAWRPAPAPDHTLFSESVSWQVMDMLSDAAARHRRFGPGLPLEAAGAVAAKTGTASGLSDLSAILATREYLVAAWAGRFDGEPTHGTSGMWAAAPLATRALVAALGGRTPSLPARPTELALARAPQPLTLKDHATARERTPPPELEPWAERARAFAGRKRGSEPR